MDWELFALAMGLYALSFAPAFVSHYLRPNPGVRAMLAVTDGVLDVACFVALWYSFSNTWRSLVGCLLFFGIAVLAASLARDQGWDPYGAVAAREAKERREREDDE